MKEFRIVLFQPKKLWSRFWGKDIFPLLLNRFKILMYQPLGNSDNDIVKKIQDGNKEYFEILVTRYKAKISGFIYRFGCKEDVEDLLQEVFLKAYKNLKSFDPNWKFQTWLYMIAQQLCCNFLDAQRLRRHKNIEEVPAPIAPGIDPKTRTIQIERDVKLQQAMN